jgi:hypothetical protein
MPVRRPAARRNVILHCVAAHPKFSGNPFGAPPQLVQWSMTETSSGSSIASLRGSLIRRGPEPSRSCCIRPPSMTSQGGNSSCRQGVNSSCRPTSTCGRVIPDRVQVCLDETSKQLITKTRVPIPMKAGTRRRMPRCRQAGSDPQNHCLAARPQYPSQQIRLALHQQGSTY